MKTRESRVMLEAAMMKRDRLDRVVSSDDRHTLIKMWQFMMDAMEAAQGEARAEAFRDAVNHLRRNANACVSVSLRDSLRSAANLVEQLAAEDTP